MKIISKPKTIETVEYFLEFMKNGGGFSFPCSKDGIVDTSSLAPEGLTNYNKCLAQTEIKPKLYERNSSYRMPMVIKCNCNTTLELWNSENDCPNCSTIFNIVGQELAPRDQWEEDTCQESFYDP